MRMMKLQRKPQGNGCYCAEAHSSPASIVAAFARCDHPEGQRVYLDASGVERVGKDGLPFCCHCGAHQRASDGAWVYGHLAASACNYIRQRERPSPPPKKKQPDKASASRLQKRSSRTKGA